MVNKKENADIVIAKMKDNLKKLKEKKTAYSEKVTELNTKIKKLENDIQIYEENAKIELLKNFISNDMTIEELEFFSNVNEKIGAIFKNIVKAKNPQAFLDELVELCQSENTADENETMEYTDTVEEV